MALVVYLAAFVTALGCALVLLAAHRRSGSPLLLWSSVCFFGLAFNEAIVLLDVYVVTDISLLILRRVVGLLAACGMLFALILHPRDGK